MNANAELASQVVGSALAKQFPGQQLRITVDHADDEARIAVEWQDGPRTSSVRGAANAAIRRFSPAQRGGWKIIYRHTPSRHMRLRVREAVRRCVPDWDFITETGDMNPDSKYRYASPEVTIGGDVVDGNPQDAWLLVKHVAYLLRRADGEEV